MEDDTEPSTTTTTLSALRKRYYDAAHGMQAGVSVSMAHEGEGVGATSPKELRVAANCALTDIGSISALLVSKGILSEEELWIALVSGMESEKARYEAEIKALLDKDQNVTETKITLI